jgi:1-acyl-sn-glycerol-3-phosphate acyltransferase
MLLYLVIPLILMSAIVSKMTYILTKNSDKAQKNFFRFLFAFQWLILGCKFNINQQIHLKKKIFMICNHPSYFDPLPIFWWAHKNGRMQDLVFVGKESVSKSPLVGEIIKHKHLMIKRDFETDKQRIIDYCNNLNSSDKPYIFVIFPEGTTYADCTIKKSDTYATENKIERFKNVLFPRVKGTELILTHLKPDSILDMTIIYDDYATYYNTKNGIPFASSQGLITGQYPRSIHIDIHDMTSEILKKDSNISDVIISRWREKDTLVGNTLRENNYNSSIDKITHFLIIIYVLNFLFLIYNKL